MAEPYDLIVNRYMTLAAAVRKRQKADSVFVLVLGGKQDHGYGFSGDRWTNRALPLVLRSLANQIEADLEEHRSTVPDRAENYPSDGARQLDLSPQPVVVSDECDHPQSYKEGERCRLCATR